MFCKADRLFYRHYFYVLRGEYIVPVTPKSSWFSRQTRHEDVRGAPSPIAPYPGKKAKKRVGAIIVTQNMIIDVDPKKASQPRHRVIGSY